MKLIFYALAFSLVVSACNNKNAETDNDDGKDTTIVIQQNSEPEKPAVQPEKPAEKPDVKVETPPPAPKPDWRALMAEYHDVLCRRHKGNPQPNDAIRQVELTKELNDIRETLSKDEKFSFAAEMARAANMASCP